MSKVGVVHERILVQFSSVQFSSVQFSSVQFSSVQFSSVYPRMRHVGAIMKERSWCS